MAAVTSDLIHFALFTTEAAARAFPLPPGCELYQVQPPDDGEPYEPDSRLNPWAVIFKGPWPDPWEGEEFLTRYVAEHGGEYDGTEDVNE